MRHSIYARAVVLSAAIAGITSIALADDITINNNYHAQDTAFYCVPATIAVGNGAHWVDVNGVKTIGAIGRNTNYIIQGYRVRDPWTGYWQSLPANQRAQLPPGLGRNSYFRYGFDQRANGTTRPGL